MKLSETKQLHTYEPDPAVLDKVTTNPNQQLVDTTENKTYTARKRTEV